MMIAKTKSTTSLLLLIGTIGMAGSVRAQQPAWTTEPTRPAAGPQAQTQVPPQTPPKATPKAAPKQAPAARPQDDTAAAARPTDSQLRQRVEQLEEQLADMQVMIGTIESLGKGAGSASASQTYRGSGGAAVGGVDQARVDSLVTQIRALSNQVEQLSGQVRQLSSRRGESVPSSAPATAALPDAPANPRAGTPATGFGAVTVTPGAEADPIGRMIAPPAAPGGPSAPLPPAAASAGSPKELYETAYGYLLQQDYGSAEVAFEEFLRRYPADRLSPDAQYWYGETLYVQRRYKPAGQAFLKVIEKHQASAKVPNSILKLAMTLEQLGQKDCALFSELDTRHPNAPADVKSKARAMKQRVGC